jgi:hypothetical protein
MNVQYRSPGNGLMRFGWEDNLSVDNVQIQLKDYRRYDNHYSKSEFSSHEIKVTVEEHELILNWQTGERKTS